MVKLFLLFKKAKDHFNQFKMFIFFSFIKNPLSIEKTIKHQMNEKVKFYNKQTEYSRRIKTYFSSRAKASSRFQQNGIIIISTRVHMFSEEKNFVDR